MSGEARGLRQPGWLVRRRPASPLWIGRSIEPLLVVLGFLALFELVARLDLVGGDALPPATTIADAFFRDITDGVIWSAMWATVRSWAIAMAIVVAIGVPLGLLLGTSRVAYHSTRLTIEVLRTVPSIAALPFLILVYGVGPQLTIVLVVLAALWPLLFQAMSGAHDVDPVARDMARVYGVGRLRAFRSVVLPSAMPYIATGLRISGTLGMLLAIGASLFAGGEGLGAELAVAQNSSNAPLTFARAFTAGLLGLVVLGSLLAFERRALAWHPSQREAGA